jgi:hypothetical protein
MFPTIFKLALPFLQRYFSGKTADYAADYLNRRRERRLRPPEEDRTSDEEAAEVPHCPQAYSAADMFWFTLSGVVLGGALGMMLAQLAKQEE